MMKLESYRPQSEWGKRFFAEGEALGRREGEALGRRDGLRDALQWLLRSRGLSLDPQQRAAVAQCTDEGRLQQWLERAATATAPDEVFGDG